MKKNTKIKVFTLMLVIMLLSIAIVGGSLAWFTAEDEVTNTFTQGQTLMPIVNMAEPSKDTNYMHKVVTLENTGKNPAYVRTHIAYPIELFPDYLKLDIAKDTGWQREGFYLTDDYAVYYYYHIDALDAGDVTLPLLNGVYLDAKTDVQVNPESGKMEFCMWDSSANAFDFSNFIVTDDVEVEIIIITQAVQAEGFNGFPEDALLAAFGEPRAENTPINP